MHADHFLTRQIRFNFAPTHPLPHKSGPLDRRISNQRSDMNDLKNHPINSAVNNMPDFSPVLIENRAFFAPKIPDFMPKMTSTKVNIEES